MGFQRSNGDNEGNENRDCVDFRFRPVISVAPLLNPGPLESLKPLTRPLSRPTADDYRDIPPVVIEEVVVHRKEQPPRAVGGDRLAPAGEHRRRIAQPGDQRARGVTRHGADVARRFVREPAGSAMSDPLVLSVTVPLA